MRVCGCVSELVCLVLSCAVGRAEVRGGVGNGGSELCLGDNRTSCACVVLVERAGYVCGSGGRWVARW
jgi:alpha-D-ribose 1-methylphosphonate 5-triphosphate synthase subunit PhnG